jgi:hypothetical protein
MVGNKTYKARVYSGNHTLEIIELSEELMSKLVRSFEEEDKKYFHVVEPGKRMMINKDKVDFVEVEVDDKEVDDKKEQKRGGFAKWLFERIFARQ